MSGFFTSLRSRFDSDALRALLLYAGAMLMLTLACANDLERGFRIEPSPVSVGVKHAVGR